MPPQAVHASHVRKPRSLKAEACASRPAKTMEGFSRISLVKRSFILARLGWTCSANENRSVTWILESQKPYRSSPTSV